MISLQTLRLALSGALAGVAILGIITGNADRELYDFLAACVGFAAVYGLRFLRFV